LIFRFVLQHVNNDISAFLQTVQRKNRQSRGTRQRKSLRVVKYLEK
jgi:hypothetical protein